MSASLPILLIGCANSISGTIDIGDPPPGLVACTVETVPALPGSHGTAITKSQATSSLGEQRTSALAKGACAGDWLDFYNDLRQALLLKGVGEVKPVAVAP